MKYLSVAMIFWLTIWTVPKCPNGWPWRALVIAWGFYLCRKILTADGRG